MGDSSFVNKCRLHLAEPDIFQLPNEVLGMTLCTTFGGMHAIKKVDPTVVDLLIRSLSGSLNTKSWNIVPTFIDNKSTVPSTTHRHRNPELTVNGFNCERIQLCSSI